MAGLVEGQASFFFEHCQAQGGQLFHEIQGGGKADDTAADDDNVKAGGGTGTEAGQLELSLK